MILVTSKRKTDFSEGAISADYHHLHFKALKKEGYYGIVRNVFFFDKKNHQLIKYLITHEGFPRSIQEVGYNTFCFDFGNNDTSIPNQSIYEKEMSSLHTVFIVKI